MYSKKDHEDTIKGLVKFKNKTRTKRSAFNSLYKCGIINKDGSLTFQYGGKYTDEDHPEFKKDKFAEN